MSNMKMSFFINISWAIKHLVLCSKWCNLHIASQWNFFLKKTYPNGCKLTLTTTSAVPLQWRIEGTYTVQRCLQMVCWEALLGRILPVICHSLPHYLHATVTSLIKLAISYQSQKMCVFNFKLWCYHRNYDPLSLSTLLKSSKYI